MEAKLTLSYIADGDVDAALDRELRDLLSTCFIKPGDEVFRQRRYFIDPPQHRWLLRDDSGRLIAHSAAHEKTIFIDSAPVPLCGVAEVCVHPEARHQGHVRRLLAALHPFMAERGFAFSALSGNPDVYRSSGYRVVHNLYYQQGDQRRPFAQAMVHEMAKRSWPQDEVFLLGNFF